MSAAPAHDRFGPFYMGGYWARTIAFRVDDPDREGFKKIVCGTCVPDDQAGDGRVSAGEHRCEKCGEFFGRSEAHRAAIAKSGGPA